MMKKRMISLVLTMALAASLLAAIAPGALAADEVASGTFGTNLRWELYSDGLLKITRVNLANASAWPDHSATNAPWYSYRDAIQTVEIESSITSGITRIGNYAFNGAVNLKSLSTPSEIIHIGNFAFNGCINLESIEMPSVTHIGNNAFNGCVKLKDVSVPVAQQIGEQAFNGCIALTEIDLGRITHLQNYAFNGCVNLKKIILPQRMTFFGTGVFAGCRSFLEVDFDDVTPPLGSLRLGLGNQGELFCGSEPNAAGVREARIIKAPVNLIGVYEIPRIVSLPPSLPLTVTGIDVEAYAYNSAVTEVVIPETVTTIGENAFSWSGNLVKASFFGFAPTVPQVPNISQPARIFDYVANGFTIYFNHFTTGFATGWPTASSNTWRGYRAIANSSYVLIEPSTPITIRTGSTAQFYATVYPLNATQNVEWDIMESSDPDVATVTQSGLVVGVKAGWALIRVKVLGMDTFHARLVQVVDQLVPVTGVSLSNTSLSLTAGSAPHVLSAVIYPANASNMELTWTSNNQNVAYMMEAPPVGGFPNQRQILPLNTGTTTITVRTADGNFIATCIVTVTADPEAPMSFVPVSNITLASATVAMGSSLDLNSLSTVLPANATYRNISSWSLISESEPGLIAVADLATGVLKAEWGRTGAVVVEATVNNGLSDGRFEPFNQVPYKQRFTISIVSFLPVASITDVPALAFVGRPLQLTGTVLPTGASHKDIEWQITNQGGTNAYLDPVTGMIVAQNPGAITVRATVINGLMNTGTTDTLRNYTQDFVIQVRPYDPHPLTVRAEPGGTVSAGGQYAHGEEITITATPNVGYVFSGWNATGGGTFANARSAATQYTMPPNAATVSAYFTYVGFIDSWTAGGGSGWAGGSTVPGVVHYFTNGTVYTRNTGISFAFVSLRDYRLFNYVTLNGARLTRNAHFTADRVDGFTQITLLNGYLDQLNQGAHTLTVYFTDRVTSEAVFSVIVPTTVLPQTYDDVHPSDWFYAGVTFSSDRRWVISSPTEPRRFRPSDPVTQGEVIDAMYVMAGSPSVVSMHGQVLQGRDAAYEWVLANSITPLGGRYNLDSEISRQDIVLLLSRLVTMFRMNYPVRRPAPSFGDDWAIDPAVRGAVTSFFRAEIINGRTQNTFVPLGNMTRAEFAVVLQRFANAMGRW